jgi:hypothetical protein
MNNLDLSTWPTWAILVLLVVSTFKSQIGLVIPTAVREFFAARRFSARQQVGETQLLSLVQERDDWIRKALDRKLDRLVAGSDQTNEHLAAIREALARR